MKIAIVNDVAMACEALRRVVAAMPEHELAWIARSGAQALALCQQQRPDLVLMDLVMPEMDGVEATRQIMQHCPCAILVVTADPKDNVSQVFRALGAGALDVTATPVLGGDPSGDHPLRAKISMVDKLVRASIREQTRTAAPVHRSASGGHLLAIGASTGGPAAIARMLAGWRSRADTSIVVVQHIDQQFGRQFAAWLGEQLSMPVQVIEPGDALAPGRVQVAMTNDHLLLDERHRLHYQCEPADYAYRPSVDAFFHSVARHWSGAATGVLLTGMGSDGADGLLALRRAGKLTIAQDEASCAVYGMPRAAAELKAAQLVLPLTEIGPLLMKRLGHAASPPCPNGDSHEQPA